MIDEARQRVLDLQRIETRLEACAQQVRDALMIAKDELVAIARVDMNRPRLSDAVLLATPKTSWSTEEIRDVVVRLRTFTLSELAAELECSVRHARIELARVEHLVNQAGKFGGKQMWTYCVPEGPGAAFEAQQRLRVVEPDERVAGGQDIKQSMLSMISDKEIKGAVREAIADGWELVHAGGKHPMRLIQDGHRPITISSTPRNSGNAARAIRRQVRQAS